MTQEQLRWKGDRFLCSLLLFHPQTHKAEPEPPRETKRPALFSSASALTFPLPFLCSSLSSALLSSALSSAFLCFPLTPFLPSLVEALVRMRPEVVALGLEQVLGEAGAAEAVTLTMPQSKASAEPPLQHHLTILRLCSNQAHRRNRSRHKDVAAVLIGQSLPRTRHFPTIQ